MSEKNIVKLLEQISVPLTSSRDCNQAFIVAYDIYSDGYHHSYSEVTRFLLRNQNSEFDNIEKLKQYVNVYYIWDRADYLNDKDSPVDRGQNIFMELYEQKLRYR